MSSVRKEQICALFKRLSKTSPRVHIVRVFADGDYVFAHTEDEFYQLLTYRDDVDIEKKLAVWERFYNFDRPHGAHGGKMLHEALREKLS
jgi:predicted SnoaL-like aldol condensation-catalyzing enzyme